MKDILKILIYSTQNDLTLKNTILFGTPTVDDIGIFEISLSISDGENVITQFFNLEVESVNDAPVSEGASFTTSEDENLEIILIANDEETPDDLQFNVITEPLYGTLTSSRSLGYFK